MTEHPDVGISDPQLWRRSTVEVARPDVDSVIAAKFRVNSNDNIATAGSYSAHAEVANGYAHHPLGVDHEMPDRSRQSTPPTWRAAGGPRDRSCHARW